jgi:hypothetical protein
VGGVASIDTDKADNIKKSAKITRLEAAGFKAAQA